jgi:hypothetical protein
MGEKEQPMSARIATLDLDRALLDDAAVNEKLAGLFPRSPRLDFEEACRIE